MLVPLAILDALLGDQALLEGDELLIHFANTLDSLVQLLSIMRVFLPQMTRSRLPLFLEPSGEAPDARPERLSGVRREGG